MTNATPNKNADCGNAAPTRTKRKTAPRKETAHATLAKATNADALIVLLSRPKGASLAGGSTTGNYP